MLRSRTRRNKQSQRGKSRALNTGRSKLTRICSINHMSLKGYKLLQLETNVLKNRDEIVCATVIPLEKRKKNRSRMYKRLVSNQRGLFYKTNA
jgi:hypothetical protein